LYYLYTYSDGAQVMLASVDGSISAYINLDTLEFSNRGYTINIGRDALFFSKTAPMQAKIYYYNTGADNTALRLRITRMDTSTLMLDTDTFSNPNEFTLYWDWSTYPDVNSSTLFKVVLDKTKNSGTTETITEFFNADARSGVIPSAVAFVIVLLMLIFGLTFSRARNTFGWFGIFICLACIVILSFAVPAWYITFMVVVSVISLIYIFLLMLATNPASIGG
jgi:hypothetical protein